MWIIHTFSIPKYSVGDVVVAGLAWSVIYMITAVTSDCTTMYHDIIYLGNIIEASHVELRRSEGIYIHEYNILRYR